MAYNVWPTISVGCLVLVAIGAGKLFENEMLDLKYFNDRMIAFTSLQALLVDAKPYADAINDIQTLAGKWPVGDDETRVGYTIELMKAREFSEQLLCSQAAFASAYVSFLAASMDSENRNAGAMIAVSNAVGKNAPLMMAVLEHLEVGPPRWLVMVSLFAHDVAEKATAGDGTLDRAISGYLRSSAGRIVSVLTAYNKLCLDFSIDTAGVIAKTTGYANVIAKLGALTVAVGRAVDGKLLSCASAASYDFRQWTLMEVVTVDENLNAFMPENELSGVSWDELRRDMRAKFDGATSYATAADDKNWMLDMYESRPRMQNGVHFLLKHAYRTVVLRHVLTMVTYCDNMKAQLTTRANAWDGKIGQWKVACKPVSGVASEAVELLGEDAYLSDALLPLLNAYAENGGTDASAIVVSVMRALNGLSGMLGIDAGGHVAPLPDATATAATWDQDGIETIFPQAKRAFSRAAVYTSNIRRKFPHVNFRIIDAIMNA